MKVKTVSLEGRRCSSGVKRVEWVFFSVKMKGPSLAMEPQQFQYFPGLLPKSLSEVRNINETALRGKYQQHRFLM